MQTNALTESFSAVIETISAKKRRYKFELSLGASLLIAACLGMATADGDMVGAFALLSLGLFGLYSLQINRFKKHSTDLIMPLLCNAVEGLAYNGLQEPPFVDREKELLLPGGYFSGHSISLTGKFGNQWFRQFNVTLEESDGDNTKTTFRGVVLQLPPLGIAPPLLVRPNSRARGALGTWVFGPNDPMPAKTELGRLSANGEALTLFAPDKATIDTYATNLKALIATSDATFTDSATIDAALITQSATWLAISDNSLPFSIGGLFQSRTALAADIERASAELAVPLRLMQLWVDGLCKKPEPPTSPKLHAKTATF